jgi:hypothetical protein
MCSGGYPPSSAYPILTHKTLDGTEPMRTVPCKKSSRTQDSYAQIHIHKNLTKYTYTSTRAHDYASLLTSRPWSLLATAKKQANPPWNGYCHSQRTSVQSLAVTFTFREVETSVSSKNQQKPTGCGTGDTHGIYYCHVSTGRKLGSTYLQRTFNVPDASDLSGTTPKSFTVYLVPSVRLMFFQRKGKS